MRIETGWQRVRAAVRIFGLPVLVINLNSRDLGELLQVGKEQLRNRKMILCPFASPGQIDPRHSICEFIFTKSFKTIINGNVAIEILLVKIRPMEI